MGPDTRRFTKSDTKQHIITYKDAMNAGNNVAEKELQNVTKQITHSLWLSQDSYVTHFKSAMTKNGNHP